MAYEWAQRREERDLEHDSERLARQLQELEYATATSDSEWEGSGGNQMIPLAIVQIPLLRFPLIKSEHAEIGCNFEFTLISTEHIA